MSPRARTLVATIGAAVVVVAAVIVILVVGFVPVPDYPSLAGATDSSPLGRIAYSVGAEDEHEGEFDERCVHVVDATTGSPTRVLCRDGLGWAMGWTDDGHVVAEDHHRGFEERNGSTPVLLIEPEAGGGVEPARSAGEPRFLWPEQRTRRDDGTRVDTEDDGRGVVLRSDDGATRVIVHPDEAPSNYRFIDPQWSPDGRFVLVTDTEGRLLVVTAEEEPEAYVLVETGIDGHDVGVAAWYIEGNDTYTIGLDDLTLN